jgi:hypothetical protein
VYSARGLELTANCTGTIAAPAMNVDANGVGNVNDQIFQGESITAGVVTNLGPTDGDLDTGDNIDLGTLTGNQTTGFVINQSEPPTGAFTNLQLLGRTKTSTGGTPTQGTCAFVGWAVSTG